MRLLFRLHSALPAVFLAALAACDGGGTGAQNAAPARMDVVSGETQSGAAGTELAQPLAVRVLDAGGKGLRGRAVAFRVAAGDGRVTPATAVTDADGVATARWTVGTSVADSQRVVATVEGGTATAEFRASVSAGPAASLAAVGVTTLRADAGQPAYPGVRVRDAYGNLVPGALVRWRLETGAGLDSVDVAADASGVSGPQGWRMGTRVDTMQRAVASLGALAPVEFTATPTVPVNAVVARSGDGQSVEVGSDFQPLAVTVKLTDDRPVRGALVRWSGAPGVLDAVTTRTGADGRASVQPRVPAAPLSASVTATVEDRPALRFDLAAVPGGGVPVWRVVPAGGVVMDVDDGRVLWVEGTGAEQVVKTRSRAGGTELVAATRAGLDGAVVNAALASGGVVVATAGSVYATRAGVETRLGSTSAPASVQAAGGWVAWNDGASLFRAALAGTPETVSTELGAGFSLAPNGDLAWGRADRLVSWLHGGTRYTPPGQGGSWLTEQMGPRTDGVRLVYGEAFRAGQPGAPSSSAVWSSTFNGATVNGCTASQIGFPVYLVNGGWMACAGVFTVTVTNPAGVSGPLFGGVPRALGADGAALLSPEGAAAGLVLSLPSARSTPIPVHRACDRLKWIASGEFVCFSAGAAYTLAY